MALAEVNQLETPPIRSASAVRSAGRRAAERLAQAERLRAAAVADLVEYHDGFGPSIDGYLTPQRHLIVEAGVAGREANRLQRLTRFCVQHPIVAQQLAAGAVTLDHADALLQVAGLVDADDFADALLDLLAAAEGVELAVFADRVRMWAWRTAPEVTEEDVATAYDNRSLTLQPGLFGGSRINGELDAAGTVIVTAALDTDPDPTSGIETARTLAQRNADRLVELCGLALTTSDLDNPVAPEGARQGSRPTVDVVLDLPTLLGADFNLDNHRNPNGDVDWDTITAGFALTGSAPRPALAQFFCDASWRTLITSGGSVVLDYTHAKPELNRAQRRAVQRRDQHCQFHGCDRHWSWCEPFASLTPGVVRRGSQLPLVNASAGHHGKPHPAVPKAPHPRAPRRLAIPWPGRANNHHQPLTPGRWCKERQPNTGLPARTNTVRATPAPPNRSSSVSNGDRISGGSNMLICVVGAVSQGSPRFSHRREQLHRLDTETCHILRPLDGMHPVAPPNDIMWGVHDNHVTLAEAGGSPCELVHATNLGPLLWLVNSTPGIVNGCAAGDRVRVAADGTFDVIERGGNIAVHIYATNPIPEDDLIALRASFADNKATLVEWPSSRTFAVATIPATVGFPLIEQIMAAFIHKRLATEWCFGNVYDPGGQPLNWW